VFFRGDANARLSVDGTLLLDRVPDDGHSLPAGRHQFLATLGDRQSAVETMDLSPRERLMLRLDDPKRPGSALGAAAASALLPGSCLALFPRTAADGTRAVPGRVLVKLGATLFYAAALAWAVDEVSSAERSPGDANPPDEGTHTLELGAAGCGYLINIVGAIVFGSEHSKRGRSLRLIREPDAGASPSRR
jgi:hypothetical protein